MQKNYLTTANNFLDYKFKIACREFKTLTSYKHAKERKTVSESRLGVGSCMLVNVTHGLRESASVDKDVLEDIYKQGSLERLERKEKPRTPAHVKKRPKRRRGLRRTSAVTKKKHRTSQHQDDSVNDDKSTSSKKEKKNTAEANKTTVLAPFEWSQEPKKANDEDFLNQKSIALRRRYITTRNRRGEIHGNDKRAI